MSDLVSARVPQGTYFLTARLQDRHSDLLVREVVLLRRAMRLTKERLPFHIEAIVILPATIHAIWVLPEEDTDIAARWNLLKRTFAADVSPNTHRTQAQADRGDRGIWHKRIWQHPIRDAADLAAHQQIIHTAPVQAGLVAHPQDWSWSSLHRELHSAHRRNNPHPPMGYSTFARQKRA